jgi:hypothetical protein
VVRRLLILAIGLLAASVPSNAQSDLDALMERVLSKRDENWKKLQQYVLDEDETFQLTGPGGIKVFGSRREYLWYPDDMGRFIKSPTNINGVELSDAQRRRAEQEWLGREERRRKRVAERAERDGVTVTNPAANPDPPSDATELTETGMREALEPGFISAAYFLRFKFEPGHYALVGRETLEGRNVLRIEYYPAQLFREGRQRPNRELRDRDRDIEAKMNKSSMVTLWIDRDEGQILKYDFDNVDLDFLPGRQLVRIGSMDAVMEMGQPFPTVWLPRAIRIAVPVTLATGEMQARYDVKYHDYRLAETSGSLKSTGRVIQ